MELPEYNYILITATASWITAQIIKTLIVLIRTRKFNFERLFGPGGMPSGHSAMVCSGTLAVSRQCGTGSPEFAIMFMLALIVMYDAMGVRRSAGMHAREINLIKRIMKKQQPEAFSEPAKMKPAKELKEILGHTPLEVLSGAMLGIIMALVMPMSI
ncbi:MAG: divergent PAP2 family protein [Oscillospiraceae bacterium]|nr:divergent PAP2 family protein [Oscillospiraceae bacterium]